MSSPKSGFQEKIAPQRITLSGGPDDEFVIRKKDGTAVFTVTGDGKIGWNGAAPAAKGAALTAVQVASTGFTHQAPAPGDYTIANPLQNTGFGFSTADEMNSVLAVIKNLLVRSEQVEARLQAAGIIS